MRWSGRPLVGAWQRQTTIDLRFYPTSTVIRSHDLFTQHSRSGQLSVFVGSSTRPPRAMSDRTGYSAFPVFHHKITLLHLTPRKGNPDSPVKRQRNTLHTQNCGNTGFKHWLLRTGLRVENPPTPVISWQLFRLVSCDERQIQATCHHRFT